MLKLTIIFMFSAFVNAIEDNGSIQLNSIPYPLQSIQGPFNINTSVSKSPGVPSVINELMSTVVVVLSNAVKYGFVFILNNVFIVTVSSLLTLALCALTTFCSDINKVSPFRQIQLAVKFVATPHRILQMADFVHEAIRKYSIMQSEDQ